MGFANVKASHPMEECLPYLISLGLLKIYSAQKSKKNFFHSIGRKQWGAEEKNGLDKKILEKILEKFGTNLLALALNVLKAGLFLAVICYFVAVGGVAESHGNIEITAVFLADICYFITQSGIRQLAG